MNGLWERIRNVATCALPARFKKRVEFEAAPVFPVCDLGALPMMAADKNNSICIAEELHETEGLRPVLIVQINGERWKFEGVKIDE